MCRQVYVALVSVIGSAGNRKNIVLKKCVSLYSEKIGKRWKQS
jgi:hypothetical protein